MATRLIFLLFLLLLVVDAQAASVLVTWRANPESDIAFYRVYQGTSAGSYGICTNEVTGTNFLWTGLGEGTWCVAVSAVNNLGPESQLSEPLEFGLVRTGLQITATVEAQVGSQSTNLATLTVTNGFPRIGTGFWRAKAWGGLLELQWAAYPGGPWETRAATAYVAVAESRVMMRTRVGWVLE